MTIEQTTTTASVIPLPNDPLAPRGPLSCVIDMPALRVAHEAGGVPVATAIRLGAANTSSRRPNTILVTIMIVPVPSWRVSPVSKPSSTQQPSR